MKTKSPLSSGYTKSTTDSQDKSSETDKPLQFNKLLLGKFDPDIRPFEWPQRRIRFGRRVETKQLELFPEEGHRDTWNKLGIIDRPIGENVKARRNKDDRPDRNKSTVRRRKGLQWAQLLED